MKPSQHPSIVLTQPAAGFGGGLFFYVRFAFEVFWGGVEKICNDKKFIIWYVPITLININEINRGHFEFTTNKRKTYTLFFR